MSTPELKIFGDLYSFVWPKWDLSIELDRLHDHKDGHITGEVKITTTAPGFDHYLHRSTLNLSSQRTRDDLAKAMFNKYDLANWDTVIEQLCWMTLDHYRAGEPILIVGNGDAPVSTNHLLYPLLIEKQPTLIYGEGGTGKSYLALFIALSTQLPYDAPMWHPDQTNVLYLDWETDGATLGNRAKRLKSGMKLPDELSLPYRRCSMPLADDITAIKRAVDEYKVGLVIIDSCGGACGGDPSSPETCNRFFTALRTLNVTSLLIHHVPKHANPASQSKDKSPYGSAYFFNWSRAVFLLRRAQDVVENEIDIGLIHKKANDDNITTPMGFHMTFHDDQTHIQIKGDISDVPDFLESLSNPMRIKALLKDGALDVDSIASSIDCTKDVAAATLRRMKDNKLTVKLPNGKWGLSAW